MHITKFPVKIFMLITNMNDASNLVVEALRFEDQFLQVHVLFFFLSL